MTALLAVALAVLARDRPVLEFDAVTQSVYVSGIPPRVLEAIGARSPGPAALSRALGVFFDGSGTAMLGDYRVERGTLWFTPRFPLVPERIHHAVFDTRMLSILAGEPAPATVAAERLSFRVEASPPRCAARVTGIYPSGGVVPANLLRVYVQFSQPMARRGIGRSIHLLDERGTPVEHPFLDMEDGLWDREGRRLTLFFDPGRVKRGLALHDSLGPPLKSGQRYRLVISQDVKDADGRPLAEGFEKEFQVVAEDRSAPDPSTWIVKGPRSGGREALIVVSSKPLDEPLFEGRVRAEDPSGRPVPGDAVVEHGGTQWRFVPADPWRAGRYVLRVGADLEDLAGNRPGRLFDEPADSSGLRKVAREALVPFVVRP
jgi:hypothetical protein